MRRTSLLSSSLLGGFLSITGCGLSLCESLWSCPANMSSAAPVIKWQPSRVPIGASSFEVWVEHASGVTATLEVTGSGSIPATVTQQMDSSWLTIKPTWGTSPPGPANLVLKNDHGSDSKALTLVKVAFAAPTAIGVPGATPWLSIGKFGNALRIFGLDTAAKALWHIDYSDFAPKGMRVDALKGQVMAVPTGLINAGASVFFSVPPGSQQDLVRVSVDAPGNDYAGNTLLFGKPWGIVSVAALGAGALDQDRTLVLVGDANKALYTCIYTVSSDSGEACKQSFSLPATPISLLVQPLDKSGLGQVVALGAGSLKVLARNGAGSLTDRTSQAQLAKPTDLIAITTGDMDGDSDIDLVGVTASAVIVFLNDGSGVFSEIQTPIANIAVSRLAVGDVDKDGRPDVLLTEQTAGKVLVLLNASGDQTESKGRLLGPVEVGVAVGANGALTLDGQDTKGSGRRLIWHDPTTQNLSVADNATLP